jgi:hypothetical protein
VAEVALENFIIRHHITYLRGLILSQWVLEDLVACRLAPVAELQRMAVILFSDPSNVVAADMAVPVA